MGQISGPVPGHDRSVSRPIGSGRFLNTNKNMFLYGAYFTILIPRQSTEIWKMIPTKIDVFPGK